MIEPSEAELEITVDGTLIDLRKLTLRPGQSERLLLALKADADRDSILSVRIKLAGDTMPLDDVAFARVPRARPLKMLWLSAGRDPFTELALSSLGAGYDVLVGGPKDWPAKEPADAVLFDGWLPPEWPAKVPAVVINPPGPFGGVRVARLQAGGIATGHVRAVNLRHPMLYGVANDRVSVVQTALVDSAGLLEPLAVAVGAAALGWSNAGSAARRRCIRTGPERKLAAVGFLPAAVGQRGQLGRRGSAAC